MKRTSISPQVGILIRRADSLKYSKPKKALKFLRRAKKFNSPKNIVILGIETQCLLGLKEFKAAEIVARRATRLGGDMVNFGLLAQALLFRGELEQAEIAVNKAIRLGGGAVSLGLLTQIKLIQGKLDEAENIANQIISQKGNSDSIGFNILGEVLRKKKKYEEALAVLSNIAEKEKNYHDCLCAAYCLMHLRRFSESLAQFKQAEESLSRSKNGYFDSQIRLNAGYVFLCETMFQAGEPIEKTFLETVKNASQWLKEKAKDKNIGKHQVRDLSSALRIAASRKFGELLEVRH
ncbi:MAG: hypothetical protein PHE24_02550 [Patescibacteria group bacterium]|nr:hypothetical protein [Patescibacteria group bacterium]